MRAGQLEVLDHAGLELRGQASGPDRRHHVAEPRVAFGGTDFAAVARAMGGEGHDVRDRAGLEAALVRALAAVRFSAIACRILPRSYDGRI